MCLLCVEWQKQKITAKEAYRAIGEMLTTAKDDAQVQHLTELSDKILEQEVPTTYVNPDADQAWWNSTHPEDE